MNSLLKFYKGMKQWDCKKANGACNEPSGKIEYEQFAQVLQRNEAMRLCEKANATCNAPCGKFEYEQFLNR